MKTFHLNFQNVASLNIDYLSHIICYSGVKPDPTK